MRQSNLENELLRRAAIVQAVDAAVTQLFDISAQSQYSRLRRNKVHELIGSALGILVVQSIPARRVVIDVLKSKGVKLIVNSGVHYFKGISCKTIK